MLPRTDVEADVFDDVCSPSSDTEVVESLGVEKNERVLVIGNDSGLFSVCLAVSGCNVTVSNSDQISAERILRKAEEKHVRVDVRNAGTFDDAVGEYDTIVFDYPVTDDDTVELGIITRLMDQAPIFMKAESRIIIITPASIGHDRLEAILSDLVVKKEFPVRSPAGRYYVTVVTL